MQRTENYIEKAKQNNSITSKIKRAMPVLSLVVMASVFWTLKLTGITMAGEAFCGKTEHTHDETCGQPPLICTLTETEGHYHTENCIARHLICETEEFEGHFHAEECYTAQVECTLAESEGHSHTDECKTTTVICTTEEHTHTDECVTEEIICTLAESEGHFHSETCYTYTLICTQAESEGHSHTENCYTKGVGFICTQSEENAETVAEEHRHTAECVGAETELCCGTEYMEPHTHTEICYGPAEECQLEIHTHTAECYSDINADLETQSQWEATLVGVVPDARPPTGHNIKPQHLHCQRSIPHRHPCGYADCGVANTCRVYGICNGCTC